MKKILRLIIISLFFFEAKSQQFVSFEYFYNTDPGFGNGTSILNSPSDMEVDFTTNITIPTNLKYGLNLLFIRGKTEVGGNSLQSRWTTSQVIPIFTFGNIVNNGITSIEYFIDTDDGQGQGTIVKFSPNPSINVQTVLNLNLRLLNIGNHTLFVRAKNIDNIWSVPSRHDFNISCNSGVTLLTAQTGNWTDVSTWACGRVPTLADNVYIKTPHNVVLNIGQVANCKTIDNDRGAIISISRGAVLNIKPN